MGDPKRPPHDRGHELWTAEEGPSRMLLGSIDRWVGALLADDGITMPFMGGSQSVSATILARSDGIVVGTSAVDHMLQIWAPSLKISWMAGDGKKVSNGDEIASLSGDKETLLAMERSILNLLGQLSGIATEAKRWSARAPGQIACTGKTVWGLMDKWAVHLGGGLTHRLHRSDATMLKENDLAIAHVGFGDQKAMRVRASGNKTNAKTRCVALRYVTLCCVMFSFNPADLRNRVRVRTVRTYVRTYVRT